MRRIDWASFIANLKPSNLFLCDACASPSRLKVLDFGVARVLPMELVDAPSPLAMPTATGTVIGSLSYLSPEGAMGERVDARADLYAAALLLYLMATGRTPFEPLEQERFALPQQAYGTPVPPSQWVSSLDAEFDSLVMKGLSRRREDRYQSAREFRRSIEEYSFRRSPESSRRTSVLPSLPSHHVVEELGVALEEPAPLTSRPPISIVLFVVGVAAAIAIGLGLIVVLQGNF
ncbi:MAG: hypothetical protein QM784_05965 [Polyangiaceae bacterium]